MSYNINDLFVARNSRSGYQIGQSLRFISGASLSRGISSLSTNTTFSAWFKLGHSTNDFHLLNFDQSGSSRLQVKIEVSAGGYIRVCTQGSCSNSSAFFRDYSGWYHVVIQTTSSATNVYVNNVLAVTRSQPASGTNGLFIETGFSTSDSSGYVAEAYFVDGSVLSPDTFAEEDDNGVWRPIEVSELTYGTNGFYLKFDPSATNGIGHDHSGNGNNYNATGFSTTGTSTDVMSDTPTTNWCTLNSVDAGQTLTEGNLKCGSSNSHKASRATFGMTTGKWYWECNAGSGWDNNPAIGIMTPEAILADQLDASGTRWFRFDGDRWYDGSSGSFGTAVTSGSGDIIGMAYDGDNGTLTVYVNGTSQGTAFTGLKTGQTPNLGSSTSDVWIPATKTYNGSFNVNFGQRDFEYTPPSGYLPLNTANLPAPDIEDGSDYFQTVLWTGDNTDDRSITVADNSGNSWQPDWVWYKRRNISASHLLFDAVRGATKCLRSNSTDVENTESNALQAFESTGFQVGSDSNSNSSSYNYVSWNWLASNTSGSSNTDGTITSTVSANPTAGFSIVSYVGNNTAGATIGHGLGVAPDFIVTKDRDGTPGWQVYHSEVGATKYLRLDNNNGATTQTNRWNDTEPTATVFSVGNAAGTNGNSGDNYIAYCFAEVENYSRIGSYTGNGDNTGAGPFVWCGFKPAFIVMKSSSASDNWRMYDDKRLGYNPDASVLYPNLGNQESVSDHVDIFSNGFKLRSNNNNSDGVTYIFFAFASNPFGGDGVSPATAR